MGDRYDEEGNLKEIAHKDDHYFIAKLKEKHSKAEDMKQKIKTSFISSILIAMTIGFAGFIWELLTMYFKGIK